MNLSQILSANLFVSPNTTHTEAPPDGVTLSVAAIVAIAFSGPMLILLVAVVVVPAGCCLYHRKIRKSVHEAVAPLQRLERAGIGTDSDTNYGTGGTLIRSGSKGLQ